MSAEDSPGRSLSDEGACRVLSISGGPCGWPELLRMWWAGDGIRAILRRAGHPDRPFEALVPTLPWHLGKVLASASRRVAETASSDATGPVHRASEPCSPRGNGPRRILSRIMGGRTRWKVAILGSDPLESGPAVVRYLDCAPALQLADPFEIRVGGTPFLLAESISPSGLGSLVACGLHGDVLDDSCLPLLRLPHHLSWPFAFEREGSLFMVPETGEAREVSLWECTEFPSGWRKAATLLSGRAFHDATLLEEGGRWWLFVSVGGAHPGDHSAHLEIHHCEDLLSRPFRPHPGNPISLSIAGSRPAGRIFRMDGKLYRPSQDGRGGYGRAVIVHRIERLDEETYLETEVSRILPPEGALGIHTLNRTSDGRWLVDCLVQST